MVDSPPGDSAGLEPLTPQPVGLPHKRSKALRRFVGWMLVGLAAGMAIVLVAVRRASYDPTPPLTPALYHAAHERWRTAAPPSYDLEVRVTGSQPAVYRVEVRGGNARAAWRKGQPLTTRRTFGTWSVPGMFGTIGRDIDAVQRHAAGKADRFTPRLILRAEFDPQYSYPARYRRIEQWSTVEVAWEVTDFRVIDE